MLYNKQEIFLSILIALKVYQKVSKYVCTNITYSIFE